MKINKRLILLSLLLGSFVYAQKFNIQNDWVRNNLKGSVKEIIEYEKDFDKIKNKQDCEKIMKFSYDDKGNRYQIDYFSLNYQNKKRVYIYKDGNLVALNEYKRRDDEIFVQTKIFLKQVEDKLVETIIPPLRGNARKIELTYNNKGFLSEIKSYENDKLEAYTKIFYNSKNQEIKGERVHHFNKTPSYSLILNKYNEFGYVKKSIWIIDYDKTTMKTDTFKYKYDDKGNWIERQTLDEKGEVVFIIKREIKYYE